MNRKSKPSAKKCLAVSSVLFAGGEGVHAELVQITQVNNQIVLAGANNLDGDLTGDGVLDLFVTASFPNDDGGFGGVNVSINDTGATGILGLGFGYLDRLLGGSIRAGVKLGGSGSMAGTLSPISSYPLILRNFITGVFTDANINLGVPTAYNLDFSARVSGGLGNPIVGSVSLDRIVFDAFGQGAESDACLEPTVSCPEFVPVPEPGGAALALLAAGAIGVTSRRRSRPASRKDHG